MNELQTEVNGEESKCVRATSGMYLTFKLGEEDYALEILKVQEIMGIIDITHVPRTPDFIRGVINLRGKVIPVADLRLKFGIGAENNTDKTCIIVLQVTRDAELITMGVIVDEVSEVLDITSEQIEPAPSFGVQVDMDFIMGMGKIDKRVVIILDADRLMTGADVNAMKRATKAA
ncbi:MAG: purine-binding chemotaxis protein CheW [Candidatus Coatesbacteria bacterium]|nr:purine-binding chemotaxis protein CheW [Candidatus Coatesbacteria bacterium]